MAQYSPSIDLLISQKIVILQGPLMTSIMKFITSIGDVPVMASLLILLFAYLIYQKDSKKAMLLAWSSLTGFIIEYSLKFIVQRQRPGGAMIELFDTSYSFPSGHATFAAIFCLLLIYSFKDKIKHAWKRLAFISICILGALLVGFSRIYLGVHWFTDVITGFIIGALSFYFWRFYIKR